MGLAGATAWTDELKSAEGITRLLAERGGRLLAMLLLLALGLDSALIVTRNLGAARGVPPPASAAAPAAARPAFNPALQRAAIVNGHLFGKAGVVGGSDAPATTLALILAGVIAEKDPQQGRAIIGPNASAAKLYSVGAAIPGGARLHAVYRDKVLLERNGALESLMLPRTPMGAGVAPPPPGPPQHAALRENSSLLAGLVRIQPVYVQNKLTGYRIFPGGARGNSAFTQLGLMPGDLIQAVNGTTLDDAGRAMEVLQTLGSAGSATVTVSRNGQSQEVNLNLANLVVDAEGVEGDTAPVSGASGGANPPAGPGVRGRRPSLNPVPGAVHGGSPDAPGTMNAAPGNDAATGRDR